MPTKERFMYCKKCGKQIPDDSRFCSFCGESLQGDSFTGSEDHGEKRRVVFDGEIHKCPNCGEILDAFVTKCPSCGFELRGTKGGYNSVEALAEKLEKAEDDDNKRELISNFYVPNTKEDIIEFFTLAVSQTDDEKNNCAEAWRSKLEQTLIKAKLSFGDTNEYQYLLNQYKAVKKTVRSEMTQRFLRRNVVWLLIALVCLVGIIFIVVGCVLSNGVLEDSPYSWCVWVGGILAYCGVMALLLRDTGKTTSKTKSKRSHKTNNESNNSKKTFKQAKGQSSAKADESKDDGDCENEEDEDDEDKTEEVLEQKFSTAKSKSLKDEFKDTGKEFGEIFKDMFK